MDSAFGDVLEWSDYNERHEIIKDMRGESDSAQRQKMLSMRVEVFCAEWAQFVCTELPTDLYHRYWISTGSRRLVLMAIMNCYYNGWKVKPTQIARDMRIAKSAVTLILKEAKELGLTIVGGKNNWAHYPSLHTVKGFVHYTSIALPQSGFDRIGNAWAAIQTFNNKNERSRMVGNTKANTEYSKFVEDSKF